MGEEGFPWDAVGVWRPEGRHWIDLVELYISVPPRQSVASRHISVPILATLEAGRAVAAASLTISSGPTEASLWQTATATRPPARLWPEYPPAQQGHHPGPPPARPDHQKGGHPAAPQERRRPGSPRHPGPCHVRAVRRRTSPRSPRGRGHQAHCQVRPETAAERQVRGTGRPRRPPGGCRHRQAQEGFALI